MLNYTKNTTPITAIIPLNLRETLQTAADLSGATLDQFLLQAALKEAQEILAKERVITLSAKDADTVFSLIENPPEPSDKLKQAAIKYKAFKNEGH